eukprot:c13543_g1_i2.p1 GENE.c13543_g1_i2~~c13543_g1_i2.p1  ORF type:complete len:221 (+),score=84.41 c13543_g1_i2:55-717(+)
MMKQKLFVCLCIVIVAILSTKSVDAMSPRPPHHTPKASIYSNSKAFDFHSPILAKYDSFLISLKLKVNTWEDNISIIGEPGLIELYTSTLNSQNGLKLWVSGFGHPAFLPLTTETEHDVLVFVQKNETITLNIDDDTVTSPSMSKRFSKSQQTHSIQQHLSLRIGGGKGTESPNNQFLGEIRQIKVCSGNFDVKTVLAEKSKLCDNFEILASAFPSLSLK